MNGIVSYGAYIPYYRLKKETAAEAFGKKAGKGEKAVAYCDEDSITMETSFEEDLGADSVDLVEFVMAMEDEFDIGEVEEDELAELKTVGACVNFLVEKLK